MFFLGPDVPVQPPARIATALFGHVAAAATDLFDDLVNLSRVGASYRGFSRSGALFKGQSPKAQLTL